MQTWRAYAKINLCLEVLGRRGDGYHNLLTVMQTIDLYDTLTFEPAEHLVLTCNETSLINEDNLVLRAARMLQRVSGLDKGAAIHLEKGIPIAAGLGGGSSDAATTLVALSEMWGLNMTEANLHNLASALGADVPFFLLGGTVLVEGRGEDLTPLPLLSEHWVILARPEVNIDDKTRLMYAWLTPREFTTGTIARHMARTIREGGKIEPGLIFNAFEWVAFRRFERVDRARQQVVDAGADHVRLCGSGPSLYALFPEKAAAQAVYERLQEEGLEVYLVRTIEAKPTPEGTPEEQETGEVETVEDTPAETPTASAESDEEDSAAGPSSEPPEGEAN